MLQTLKRAFRKVLSRFQWANATVLFQSDLKSLPALPDIAPLEVRSMDIRNEDEITEWLAIMGESFNGPWSCADYEGNILNHPEYQVLETHFLMDGQRPIAAGSVGVFRKNPKIGVTHYLGARKEVRGRGLGKFMLLYMLHRLQDLGIKRCEGESKLRHAESLAIHFDFGFIPKPRAGAWNTPTGAGPFMRLVGNVMMNRLYRRRRRLMRNGQ